MTSQRIDPSDLARRVTGRDTAEGGTRMDDRVFARVIARVES